MVDKAVLKKQILLSELTGEELEAIVQKVKAESFAKGKSIFQEGESTKCMYLINAGKVEIAKTTADGWKQTLAVLTENHFFGELSLIEDKKTHGASATAIDDTEIVCINMKDFKAFEQSNPGMMYKIMKTIARVASKNVHAMNDRLIKLLISY